MDYLQIQRHIFIKQCESPVLLCKETYSTVTHYSEKRFFKVSLTSNAKFLSYTEFGGKETRNEKSVYENVLLVFLTF